MTLTDEQRAAVQYVTTSANGVDVIQPRPAPARRTRWPPCGLRTSETDTRCSAPRRRPELARSSRTPRAWRNSRTLASMCKQLANGAKLHRYRIVIYAEASTRGDATDRRRSVRGPQASGHEGDCGRRRAPALVGQRRRMVPRHPPRDWRRGTQPGAPPARPGRDPRARRAARRPPRYWNDWRSATAASTSARTARLEPSNGRVSRSTRSPRTRQ